MNLPLYKIFGMLIFVLGSTVMGIWLVDQASLSMTTTNTIFMVFNAALCFTCTGLIFLVNKKENNIIRIAQNLVALFIIAMSFIVLLQDIFQIDFGIDQFFVIVKNTDLNPHPGRMAPQTAAAFFSSGITFLLLNRRSSKQNNHLIGILTAVVLSLGLIGLATATINLDLIYSWYKYSRMAVPTAFGFILIGAAFSSIWVTREVFESTKINKEQRRVEITNLIILLLMIVTAGLTGFGILSKQLETTLNESLQETFANHVMMIENEIQQSYESSSLVTTRILLNRALRIYNKDKSNNTARIEIRDDAQTFIAGNITAIEILNLDKNTVATVGHFVEFPAVKSQFYLPGISYPLIAEWADNFYLNSRYDIIDSQGKIGEAIVERRIPSLAKLLMKKDMIGATAETRLCSEINLKQADCFPSRLYPIVMMKAPRIINGQATAMDLALRGQMGLKDFYDYRGQHVMAVYGPLGQGQLGIVVKIDTDEFFGPIRQKLEWMLGILVLLSMLGAVIQRLQLMPLIVRLVNSEKNVKIIMDNVANGIITVNDTGSVETFNPAFLEMFGYQPQEVGCQDINKFLPDVLSEKYATTGTMKDAEITVRKKNGEEIVLLINMSQTQFSSGKMFVISMQDITERKNLEKLKSEFVSTVSHELRTPLTSIRGSLGLIAGGKTGVVPDAALGLVKVAYNNCERLVRLINDILDIEKIESGKMVFNYQTVDIEGLILQTIDANRSFAEKYEVGLDIADHNLSRNFVRADPDRLIQVITNLISNAIKFSPAGANVLIDMQLIDERVKVEVKDKGTGISDEFKKHIFEKFAQADSSDRRTKGGTGLGLNIVKTIIEEMDGEIGFESEVGKGSNFFFTLPVVVPLQVSAGNIAATITNNQTILICEDEPDISRLLSLSLTNAGYKTDIASSAEEAIEKIIPGNYSAMTLDLCLPGKSGLEFLKDLRANKSFQNLPVIVVSADAENVQNTLRGEALGVVDWLVKPIDLARLERGLSFVKQIKGRVLHVEDDPDIVNLLRMSLGNAVDLVAAETVAQAREYLQQTSFDLVVLDIALPDGSGIEILDLLTGENGDAIPVILFTATDVPNDVVSRVSKALTKSRFSEDKLVETIMHLIENHRKV